jgi:Zn-dependent protease
MNIPSAGKLTNALDNAAE